MVASLCNVRLVLHGHAADFHAFVASVEGHISQRLITLRMLSLGEKTGDELLHLGVSCFEESANPRDFWRAGSHSAQFGRALRPILVIHWGVV